MVDVPSYAAELMMALGPQTGPVYWVGYDEALGAWSVGFDDGAIVYLEWAVEWEGFMVQAELGSAPSGAERVVYEAVLAYNALWRDNGGARIGIVSAEGEMALMVELPARRLTLEQLQQVLLGVKAQAASWRHGIADPGQSGPGELAASCALFNRV